MKRTNLTLLLLLIPCQVLTIGSLSAQSGPPLAARHIVDPARPTPEDGAGAQTGVVRSGDGAALLPRASDPSGPRAQVPVKKGNGKYVMVLWEPGTPIPGGDGKKVMKRVAEPDLSKIGGTLLDARDNRRIIEIPLKEAKKLRRHEAVAYLQRLWTGETEEEWKEPEETASEQSERTQPDVDTNLTWGPKAYSYDGSGNIKQIGNDQYVYDSAGRIVLAEVGSQVERFEYDSFGNLVKKEVDGANPVVIPVDGSSNRMIGVTYDAAGNVISRRSQETYTYDALNMVSSVKMGSGERSMVYDPSEERIGVVTSTDSSRWSIRDFQGQVLREYRGEITSVWYWYWNQDYIRGEGGQLLAGETQKWQYLSNTVYGGIRHYHLDHLGSVRVVTNDAHQSVSENDFYAFGATPTKSYQDMNVSDGHIDTMRFTGHQRDFLGILNTENTEYLDYMHARYYDPNLGRFLSVDPKLDLKRTLRNPQGWNRYAYVLNNPLRYVDPKGLIQYEAFLLGRSITVDISDDLTKRQQRALQRKIDASLKALNDKAEAGKLTRQDFRILSNIQEVRVVQSRVVNGQETRSSVDEKTGVFTMTDKYVSGSSAKWTASAIGHDSFHVQQFNEGGYSASRGLQSERPAMEYQLGLGRRIGLDAWSLGYLQDLINDPAQLEQYRQSPAAADHED
jgi:RHS repeat-associated protein